MKYVSPSVNETAFNCPHCSALCTQFWYAAFGEPRSRDYPLPTVVGEEGAKQFNFDDIEDREFKQEMTDWANKMGKGFPYLEKRKKSQYVDFDLNNVSISRC